MLLGTIVLTFTPSLRLTSSNLVVFMVGAVAGMFAVANMFLWGARLILGLLQIRVSHASDIILYFPALIGVVLGGTVAVWLKARLVGKRIDKH